MTQLHACIALDLVADSGVVAAGGAILAARCRPFPFACPRSGRRAQPGDSIEPVIGPCHRHVSPPAHSGRLLGQRAGARADLSADR